MQWDNFGRAIAGPDGNLLAEYKMMENFLLDTALSNSYDSYTCAVAQQAIIECLDIASASTLSGSYGNESIFNAGSEQSILEQAAVQLEGGSSLLGRLGEQIDTSSSNYFGAEAPCMSTASSGKNYGDGVINAYDIAAILWVQFGHAPYDKLSRNFREIVTVAGRDDTRWRCGRSEDKPTWMQQLGNNYCAAPASGEPGTPLAYVRRRMTEELRDELPGRVQGAGYMARLPERALSNGVQGTGPPEGVLPRRGERRLSISEQAALPGAMDNLKLDVTEWAVVPSAGRWVAIRPSQTLMVVDLYLAGFAVDAPIHLSNMWPPAFGCSTCLPDSPSSEPSVVFQRKIEYAEAGLSSDVVRLLASEYCAQIVPGSDPSTVLMGNTLSLRQQPLTAACPFDLFLWVPEQPGPGTYVARQALPLTYEASRLSALGALPPIESEAINSTAWCGGGLGVLAGSSAQDGVRGLILREPACERAAPSPPPPSYPPSPPPSPPPPLAPPYAPLTLGCTSSDALNFRHSALTDDGSCVIAGCTDARAPEYHPLATFDDGSCAHVFVGCTDPAASNYRALAAYDDGSCRLVGCMDTLALDYDMRASLPGACTAAVHGCMDSAAASFHAAANVNDGSCVRPGCMDSTRANFDPAATHAGPCTVVYGGCTNPASPNYNAKFNADDGSCSIPGCMDANASNFLPSATFNDGTCLDPQGFRRLESTEGVEGLGGGRAAVPSPRPRRHLEAGCMDPAALTYSSGATSHSSVMCMYALMGCPDPAAANYLVPSNASNYLAICAPNYLTACVEAAFSLCEYPILGCTIATGTLNYQPNATQYRAGSCVFEHRGCTDTRSLSFVSAANVDDGSCKPQPVHGCADLAALNYESVATESHGCVYARRGCADSAAHNYEADVTVGAPESCTYTLHGCMYAGADNYNSLATRDDGSCSLPLLVPRPPPSSPLPSSPSPSPSPPPPSLVPAKYGSSPPSLPPPTLVAPAPPPLPVAFAPEMETSAWGDASTAAGIGADSTSTNGRLTAVLAVSLSVGGSLACLVLLLGWVRWRRRHVSHHGPKHVTPQSHPPPAAEGCREKGTAPPPAAEGGVAAPQVAHIPCSPQRVTRVDAPSSPRYRKSHSTDQVARRTADLVRPRSRTVDGGEGSGRLLTSAGGAVISERGSPRPPQVQRRSSAELVVESPCPSPRPLLTSPRPLPTSPRPTVDGGGGSGQLLTAAAGAVISGFGSPASRREKRVFGSAELVVEAAVDSMCASTTPPHPHVVGGPRAGGDGMDQRLPTAMRLPPPRLALGALDEPGARGQALGALDGPGARGQALGALNGSSRLAPLGIDTPPDSPDTPPDSPTASGNQVQVQV